MTRSKSRVSKVRKSSRGRRSMRRSERRSKLGRKMRSGAKTRRKSRTRRRGKSKILIGGANCMAKNQAQCWAPYNGCHWVSLPPSAGGFGDVTGKCTVDVKKRARYVPDE